MFYRSQLIANMRRVRELKKSQNLIRSVQSQSREIISSIYGSSTDNDQLQFCQNQDLWNISPQNLKNVVQQPNINTQQPLRHLLPLMKHLAKQPCIDICSFIIFDYNTIQTVTQEERIKVTKNKKDKGNLRYWLSHIYFHKLRKQLTEQLVHSSRNSDQQRDVIHSNEEKQYMPTAFPAKKQTAAFVRKFKISSEAMYSKQGQSEREPFCIGYFLNGAQQLFSFTEVLSFIQYPFNLTQISYFKIIPFQKDGIPTFKPSYSKINETNQQKQRIDKFKSIIRKQERWRYAKQEMDELKATMIHNKQLESYSMLLLLEMISFLQISEFVDIKELKVQWIINQQGSYHLSNCFKYSFDTISSATSTECLVTLYEKRLMERSFMDKTDTERSFRVKKMRSEEKSFGEKSSKTPFLNWRNSANHSQMMSETISNIRRKAKSSIKCKPNKKWIS